MGRCLHCVLASIHHCYTMKTSCFHVMLIAPIFLLSFFLLACFDWLNSFLPDSSPLLCSVLLSLAFSFSLLAEVMQQWWWWSILKLSKSSVFGMCVCVLCCLQVSQNVSTAHSICISFIRDVWLCLGAFWVFEGRMCATITSVNMYWFRFSPPDCPVLLLSCSVVVEICSSVLFLSVWEDV